jgi:hypothetical protein
MMQKFRMSSGGVKVVSANVVKVVLSRKSDGCPLMVP